jgi:hypothetical protein
MSVSVSVSAPIPLISSSSYRERAIARGPNPPRSCYAEILYVRRPRQWVAVWSVCPVVLLYVRLPGALVIAEEEEHDDISSSDLSSPAAATSREGLGLLIVALCLSGILRDLIGCLSSLPDA